MNVSRYFLPEHPTLTDVYSKAELRALLQTGELSRSDMVTDDETGLSHLLGDLLAMPFPGVSALPTRSTSPLQSPLPTSHEFRAHTPLPRGEVGDEEPPSESDEPYENWDSENHGDEEEEDAPWSSVDEDEDDLMEEILPDPDAVPLAPDEEVTIRTAHPSWCAYPRSLLCAALCSASALYFYDHGISVEWLTLLCSIAGLVLLFIGLDRTTTTYIVTTRRVELEYGIIGRNTKEVRICDIRAIDVEQEGMAALLGVGTVKFDSSASEGPEVCFTHVRKPAVIKQIVRDLQGA